MRPSRVLAVMVVLLLFPGTLWAQQTIYGCVKNVNGQLRIVTGPGQCLPSEREVAWTLGGGTTTTTTPPPVTTPGPLRVLDVNGAAIGMLVTQGYAARQVNDLWVTLPVTPNGFTVTNPAYIMFYYQDTLCQSGANLAVDNTMLRTGYVMPSSSGPLALSFAGSVVAPGSTIQAYSRWNGTTWTCTPFTTTSIPTIGKVTSVDVSTFMAPFKIVQ